MQLKVFRGEAKPEQVVAAMGLVQEDLATGKLAEPPTDWRFIFARGYGGARCRIPDTNY
jgi:hypothetical protein